MRKLTIFLMLIIVGCQDNPTEKLAIRNEFVSIPSDAMPTILIDRFGREIIACGTKHSNCKHSPDGSCWVCDDDKNTDDNPFLIRHCCVDKKCKEKDWCGLIKLEKVVMVADGDYVRLRTNKETKK